MQTISSLFLSCYPSYPNFVVIFHTYIPLFVAYFFLPPFPDVLCSKVFSQGRENIAKYSNSKGSYTSMLLSIVTRLVSLTMQFFLSINLSFLLCIFLANNFLSIVTFYSRAMWANRSRPVTSVMFLAYYLHILCTYICISVYLQQCFYDQPSNVSLVGQTSNLFLWGQETLSLFVNIQPFFLLH